MEVERSTPQSHVMTFDEVSMERSKSFVRALQELKNLRPQLYSAAEYCEKSYLNSEQKQMVLDNLKDYTVRALVNAVDHIGTVAYKLTDLVDQQILDISATELQMSCLNQKILTCRVYTDMEGLRQQQLLAFIPRHHKHYTLPNSVSKKVHFSPQIQTDARQHYLQARSRLQPSDAPASKTLSWHLGSETKPTLKGASQTQASSEAPKSMGKFSEDFHLLGNEDSMKTKSSSAAGPHTFGANHRDMLEGSRPFNAAARPFDNIHAPVRNKRMLSTFFAKPKAPKMKA